MVTKQELDDWINKDYERLYDIINGMAYKYRSSLDPSYVIGLAYQDMLKKLDKIESDKISNYITSYARIILTFKNNPANKLVKYNYRHDFIQNISELDDDLEENDNDFLSLLDEVNNETDPFNELANHIDNDYIDIWIYLEEFIETLNVFDKILVVQLKDYVLDKNIDLKSIYNCSKKDSMSYKRRLNQLFNEYAEFCKLRLQ